MQLSEIKHNIMKNITTLYYKKSILCFLLLPLAAIFAVIIKIRRYFYKKAIFKSVKLNVPVIIVGNITLGGTGKTPLTIALVEYFKKQGLKPAVISRGYGSQSLIYPYHVTTESTAKLAGDEPLLIHLRTGVPVVIDPNRPNAGKAVLEKHTCDIIICDDGLQHYALQRDIEIVVVDALRQFGNGFLFPAGPLREANSRLTEVDFVVSNGVIMHSTYIPMHLKPDKIINLQTNKEIDTVKFFENKNLIAIAGIGNPDRFFETLTQMGLVFKKQAMPDHYVYSSLDFACHSVQNNPVFYIMTEKDAVKCREFATDKMFYLPVTAEISDSFLQDVLKRIVKIDSKL